MTRLKHAAAIIAGQSPESVDVVELNGGTPFIQGNAEFGARNPRPKLQCSVAPKLCQPGDVLLSVRAPVGALNVADRIYGIGRGLAAVRPMGIHGRYLWWWLHSKIDELKAEATGSTFAAISAGDIGNLELPGLDADRQTHIASYLDRETAQIDELIAKQEHLIELLAEKRQAVITQAVTKGLDPTVPTKPSGIPWQGPVPAHWTVQPLKTLMQMQTGVTLGKDFTDVETTAYAYLRVANVQVGYVDLSDVKEIQLPRSVADSSLLRPGDVLMTEGGDRDKLARGCIWEGAIDPCVHQNHIFAVRTNGELRNDFLVLALDADPARTYFYTTGKQSTNLASTNSTTVKNFRFGVPPVQEQHRIVEHLGLKTQQIEDLTNKATSVIEMLRERRSALISAAVTGKLKI